MPPVARRRSQPLPGNLPEAQPGEVLIWTDGACSGNPGPGGWAALVVWPDDADDAVQELSGGLPHTTNNVMEMTAALEGLRALPDGSRVCVVTDSRYLLDGITSWLPGWKRKGWKTAAGKPVKNQELWLALEAEVARHESVRWHWVRGHVGNELNERADVLAVAAASAAASR
jgi:ribonuclease HI